MRRIKLIVAYDGTNYCGWQVQPNGITVQEVLNQALSDLFAEENGLHRRKPDRCRGTCSRQCCGI